MSKQLCKYDISAGSNPLVIASDVIFIFSNRFASNKQNNIHEAPLWPFWYMNNHTLL